MRKRYSEEQILSILKEQEQGIPANEIIRNHGISPTTFYKWKSKYSGMDISEMKRLKSLEEENKRLKSMVADLMLDNTMLKDVNSKKW